MIFDQVKSISVHEDLDAFPSMEEKTSLSNESDEESRTDALPSCDISVNIPGCSPPLSGLVDSGSSRNLASKQAAEDLGSHKKTKRHERRCCTGAGVMTCHCSATICHHFLFEFSSNTFSDIAPDLVGRHGVTFGRDHSSKTGMCSNFDKETVEWLGTMRPMHTRGHWSTPQRRKENIK